MATKQKEKRSTVVPFRLDPDELERLDSLAKEAGRTRSDFLREAIRVKVQRRRKMPDRAALLDASQAVKGIGRNLNQLTKAAHETRRYPDATWLAAFAEEFERIRPYIETLENIALGDIEALTGDDQRV